MGSTSDKISGKTNEVVGKVKQGLGDATGNRRLEAEGAAQELKGKAQVMAGKAKDAVKNAVDRM